MIENTAAQSGFAFDAEESAVLDELCDELDDRGGDSDFAELDMVHFYSKDYAFDDLDPDIILAGTYVVCAIERDKTYRLELHSPRLPEGTFHVRAHERFDGLVADVRAALLAPRVRKSAEPSAAAAKKAAAKKAPAKKAPAKKAAAKKAPAKKAPAKKRRPK